MGRLGVSCLFLAVALAGCGTGETNQPTAMSSQSAPLSGDAALSVIVEQQVSAQVPEHDLSAYVRLYTHGSDGNVDARYISGGMREKRWESGQSYWIAANEMPAIFDGGCAVINVRYHAPTRTLVSVHCNGDA